MRRAKPGSNPFGPSARRRALLGVFESTSNEMRPKIWAAVQAADGITVATAARKHAARAIAALLGGPPEKVPGRWFDELLQPSQRLLVGREPSVEARLVDAIAYIQTFSWLLRVGHLPDAVLKAVGPDLQINHDCGSPNVLPLFHAAISRHRLLAA